MLTLSRWPSIQTIAPSGDLQADSQTLLMVNGKPKTAAHCLAVADTSKQLAARFGLDQAAAVSAALLHDVSAVIQPPDMLAYALERRWALDPAERNHPFLLHQRLSAEIAKDIFGVRNPAILSAVACHSTLKPDPCGIDMAVFLADKLSWDQEGVPPFSDAVSAALQHSLCRASLVYLHFVLEHGMILLPHRQLLDAKRWLEAHG